MDGVSDRGRTLIPHVLLLFLHLACHLLDQAGNGEWLFV
jgi:hypothetical protein